MQKRLSPAGHAVAAIAAACAVLTAAACSAATSATANANTHAAGHPGVAAAGTASGSPAATNSGCVVGAWAEKVTDAGRLAWQVSLGDAPGLGTAPSSGFPAQAVAVGGVSVFPVGDELYGLGLGDGHQVWHRAFAAAHNQNPDYVAALTVWRGSVIALADGNTPELVAIDPATGAVRWSAALGDSALELSTLTVTSDGIAMIGLGSQGSTLAAFDLSTGKRLWSRSYPKTYRVAVSGTVVIVASRTSETSPMTLTGFAARSGAALWSRTGFPSWLTSIESAPAGRVLVDATLAVPSPPSDRNATYPVIAVSASTGKTLWQLTAPKQPYGVWPSQAGVLAAAQILATFKANSQPPRFYLADPATGKVRWSAVIPHSGTFYPGSTTPLITASDVIALVSEDNNVTGLAVDFNAQTGAVRWTVGIGAPSALPRYVVQPAGPNVLVTSARQSTAILAIDMATGAVRATDRLPFTTTVAAPPTVIGADALVESQTASCAPAVHPQPAPVSTPEASW